MQFTTYTFLKKCIGLKFWKASARKFYVVPEEDLQQVIQPSEERAAKRPRMTLESAVASPSTTPSALEQLRLDVATIKDNTNMMLTLTRDLKIPLSLKLLLNESFQCHICRHCMKPPIILSKCCKNIIGCEECVNRWYSGPDALTKYCPRCRCERGYNETMRVLGLDDLLTGVRSLSDDAE